MPAKYLSAANSRLTAKARAKLNLCLYVLPPGPDGYHDLVSLFVSVSLADDLLLYSAKSLPAPGSALHVTAQGACRVDCGKDDNLVLKARDVFCDLAGAESPGGLSFSLRKRIPVRAGLGGGSADGAAALMLLNRAFGNPLDDRGLKAASRRLGADVFFQLKGGMAIGTGRGDELQDLGAPPPLGVLLVKPRQGIDTAGAFSAIDEHGAWSCGNPGEMIERARKLAEALPGRTPAALSGLVHNDFFPVVSREIPLLDRLHRAMRSFDVLACGMSGSGSALFALFDDEDRAALAGRGLACDFPAEDLWLFSGTLAQRGAELVERHE